MIRCIQGGRRFLALILWILERNSRIRLEEEDVGESAVEAEDQHENTVECAATQSQTQTQACSPSQGSCPLDFAMNKYLVQTL